MVESFKEDIATLWNDKIVRELLQERNVRFDLDGEFFLDDLDRVCAPDYEPSDGKYKSFDIPSHWSLSAKIYTLLTSNWWASLLSGCMQNEEQDHGHF